LSHFPQRFVQRAGNILVGTLLLLVSWCVPVQAERNFPQNARRGDVTAHQYPNYTIDEKTRRLAVGGKIYNEHNRIIMPVSLSTQKLAVMYVLDPRGEISKMWLLTVAEASRYKPTKPE
jgi:hypothetical protein